ncbi:MAG: MFS transporter [Thermoguttaceae bacterium]|nr:MFS transporter [Thermoguttaceae bacterium]
MSAETTQNPPVEESMDQWAPEIRKRFWTWQMRTIFATMIGYALFYFLRKNFSLAMPGLEAEMGISKTSLGIFLTLNGLIYGASRFGYGMIADRCNARVLMTLGLLCCTTVSVLFGFAPEIAQAITGVSSGEKFIACMAAVMGVLWVLNGFFQGSGFPPCARLLTHWIPPKELATKMSVWNTSHSIGAFIVVVMCGYIMGQSVIGGKPNPEIIPNDIWANFQNGMGFGTGAWRYCFWIPAGFSFLGAIGLWLALRDTPTSVGLPELPGTGKAAVDPGSGPSKSFLKKAVFGNRFIWILGLANFFVYVVRFSVLDWGPTLLSESKHVSLVHAGWLVAAFEIFGILGMLFFGWMTDAVLKGRAHRTCVICMAGSALFVLLFWLMPSNAPHWMLCFPLCGAGFCIYGPQALIGIAAANQATKRAAATANGFTGLFGYASVIVSGVGVGAMAQHVGWNLIYVLMVAISVIGMGIFLLMWNAPSDGYARLGDEE